MKRNKMCIKIIKIWILKLKLKYKKYKNNRKIIRYDVIKNIKTPQYSMKRFEFEIYEDDKFIDDPFESSYSDSDIDLSY
jgi:hypothetical protein